MKVDLMKKIALKHIVIVLSVLMSGLILHAETNNYKLLSADELGFKESAFIRRDLQIAWPNGDNPEVVTEPQWMQFLYRDMEAVNDDFEVTSRYSYYLNESNFELMAWLPLDWLKGKAKDAEIKFDVYLQGTQIASQNTTIYTAQHHRVPTIFLAIDSKHLKQGENIFTYSITIANGEVKKGSVSVKRMPKPKGISVQVDRKTWQLIVNGQRNYYYGWFGSEDSELARDVSMGVNFTLFSTHNANGDLEKMRQGLDRLEKLNVKCIINYAHDNYYAYQTPTKEQFEKSTEAFLKIVRAFKDHPAVMGYYISDEPGGSEQYKPFLVHKLKEAKKINPYHIFGIVHMSVTPFQLVDEIARYCDFLSIDTYHMPGSVKQTGRDCRFYKNYYRKFFCTIPQMFGGSEWWNREPTPREYRAKTWLELIEGSELMMFFIRGKSFPRDPESLHTILDIGNRLRLLDGFITSQETPPFVRTEIKASAKLEQGYVRTSWNKLKGGNAIAGHPLTKKHGSDTETMFLPKEDNVRFLNNRRIMSPLDRDPQLFCRAYLNKEVLMVIVVNPQNVILPLDIKVESEFELQDFAYLPFEDNRIVGVKDNKISDIIEAYDVRIYHIRTPDYDSYAHRLVQSNPNNLQENPSFERATEAMPTNQYSQSISGKLVHVTSKDAAHGLYSLYFDLRNNPGYSGTFNENYFDNKYSYPVKISFWAKAAPVNDGEKVSMKITPRDAEAGTFELSSQWKRYEYRYNFNKDNSAYGYSRWNVSYSISATAAEVWLDLFEVEIEGFDGIIKPSHYMAMAKRPIKYYYDKDGNLLDPETSPENLKSEKE